MLRRNKRRVLRSILLVMLGGLLVTPLAYSQKLVQPAPDDPANSPREELRKSLFAGSLDQRACGTVETKPDGSVPADKSLGDFIKAVIEGVEKRSAKKLLPLFHKRLNIGLPVMNQVLTDLNNVYREPFNVSIFRLWALNTVDGSTKALPCDGSRLSLYPLYGYNLQFGVWLQIMGQKELGRIYLSIVPADGRWNIGSFNAQQWTHEGKDFATWSEEAVKQSNMGYKVAAWTKLDIASKLLDGGGFVEIAMRDEILAARNQQMAKSDWEKKMRAVLKDWDVGYVASMLVTGGAGILVRLKIPAEISAHDVLLDCRKLARTMMKQKWSSYLAGVRCSYIMPKEDPAKEGALGGVFLSFDSLRKKKK